MGKVKFDMAYSYGIIAGNFRAVLGDGRPVRVIDYKCKSPNGCIVGLVGKDEKFVSFWDENGNTKSGIVGDALYVITNRGDGYPEDMDPECIDLCDALNKLPGVKTTESCCGHYTERFCVWFRCYDMNTLSRLGRCVERNYSDGRWEIIVDSCDTDPRCLFCLRTKTPFPGTAEMTASVNGLIENFRHWFDSQFDKVFDIDVHEDGKPVNIVDDLLEYLDNTPPEKQREDWDKIDKWYREHFPEDNEEENQERQSPQFRVGDTITRPHYEDHTILSIYNGPTEDVYVCRNEEGLESHVPVNEQRYWSIKEETLTPLEMKVKDIINSFAGNACNGGFCTDKGAVFYTKQILELAKKELKP